MADYNAQAVEARKMGFRQTRNKGGDWVEIRFQLHPDDAYNVGLATMALGARVSLVVAELADDQQAEQPAKAKGGPLAQEAGRLCATPAFQEFLGSYISTSDIWVFKSQRHLRDGEKTAADVVRAHCYISSRAELDHNDTAAQTWKELTDAYYDSQRGQSLDELQRVRDRA